MPTITRYETHGLSSLLSGVGVITDLSSRSFAHAHPPDVRFPTSLTGDGTDAMNTDCDYSSAYVTLYTNGKTDDGERELKGCGMTFTIGRGNDIVRAFLPY